jgi:hypothetical protein
MFPQPPGAAPFSGPRLCCASEPLRIVLGRKVHKTSEINTVAVLRFHGGEEEGAAQPDCKATSVGRKATGLFPPRQVKTLF